MRTSIILSIVVLGLTFGGCKRGSEPSVREAGREAHEAVQDAKEGAESAARKAGRIAHDLAEETEAAAKKAGKTISKAAKEAREGWKEAEREDHTKGK